MLSIMGKGQNEVNFAHRMCIVPGCSAVVGVREIVIYPICEK